MRYESGLISAGTFTDLVFLDEKGDVSTRKVLSTPEDYGRGIVSGLSTGIGIDPHGITQLMHGTTVATNAILEGKGARVGLITTLGFRDVLEIRRLRMPALYDIRWQKPPPLVPRRLRLEIPERINAKGEVERPLDEAAAAGAVWMSGPSEPLSATFLRAVKMLSGIALGGCISPSSSSW